MITEIQTWSTLPSHYYFDDNRYEQELEQIWYRNWLYVCRSSALAEPRAFRVFTVGSQNVVVLRDEAGVVQAFHNTCRHRGSMLCTEQSGQLASRRIVCPYHQWSYTLQGKLAGVPFIGGAEKLGVGDVSLYKVAVREWGGCVFVNLAEGDGVRPFSDSADPAFNEFDHWPLAELVSGHTFQTTIACNWKIFWENYYECYHCPSIHPELCDLVPQYKQGWSIRIKRNGDSNDPGVRPGAQTWSMDGLIHGKEMAELTDEERLLGFKYLTCLPTMFMSAHPDYVRIVSLLPLGPETTQLTAEWLFPAETLQQPDFDMENVTKFATLVMEQDAHVCEINQQGLHSIRHQAGVLVPHEVEVYTFHEWVRAEMGEG